jgi:lariat debranching enzyme
MELETMACPDKYKDLKDFHLYHKEERQANTPTLFVGGNHEAVSHLRELYYGGFAAPNIFYMGHSGVWNLVKVKKGTKKIIHSIRVGGISGIYKEPDTDRGYYECYPYSEESKRSAYHVRKWEIQKLLALKKDREGKEKSTLDVFVSHDWPSEIVNYGDQESLLKYADKTGMLKKDIDNKTLGNPMTMEIINQLKPKFHFSAHMHMHFEAIVPHSSRQCTRFLALDKCGFRRHHMQWLTLNEVNDLASECVYASDENAEDVETLICFDLEWLAIVRKFNDEIPMQQGIKKISTKFDSVTETEVNKVREVLEREDEVRKLSDEFYVVPYLGKSEFGEAKFRRWLCRVLEMKDVFDEKKALEKKGEDDDLFFEDTF